MQRIAYRNSRGIAPGEITGRRSMVIILEVSWRSAGGSGGLGLKSHSVICQKGLCYFS